MFSDVEIGWEPAREGEGQRLWADVIAPLARRLEASADELAPGVVARIAESVPELTPDDETAELQSASTRASLRDVAGLLARAGDPRSAVLPQATVALGHVSAHRNIGLTPLFRSYRLGHEILWQWFVDQIAAEQPAEIHAPAAQYLAPWIFAYVDRVISLVEEVYETERDAWMRSSLAIRSEIIGAVMAGRETNAQRASERLRYDLMAHHLGVVAWVPEDAGGPDLDELQRQVSVAMRQLAEALGTRQPLTLAEGSHLSMGWLTRRTAFSAAEVSSLVSAHRQGPSNVRMALGAPGTGLEGFRRTQIEAGHARRIARLLGAAPGSVTAYADVALLSMATVDEEQAAVYVAGVLGPLAADDETTSRAAETLRVFLEENRSRKAAAARLHVHANTVNYRVKQAEQTLGYPVEGDTLALRVALALLPVVRAHLR